MQGREYMCSLSPCFELQVDKTLQGKRFFPAFSSGLSAFCCATSFHNILYLHLSEWKGPLCDQANYPHQRRLPLYFSSIDFCIFLVGLCLFSTSLILLFPPPFLLFFFVVNWTSYRKAFTTYPGIGRRDQT